MATLLHGRNMIVKVDGVAIACARSCDLTIESETIEVSSPATGDWRTYTNGRKGWNISLTNLVSIPVGSETGNIREALNMVGTTVTLSFICNSSDLSSNIEYVGTALCTQSKITGTIGNLAQGSFTFQGSGELYDNSASDIYCKGILKYGVGGTKNGIYLMRDRSLTNIIDHLVLNDLTGESLVQTFLTPDTTTIYHVGDTEYIWNGMAFVEQDQ